MRFLGKFRKNAPLNNSGFCMETKCDADSTMSIREIISNI